MPKFTAVVKSLMNPAIALVQFINSLSPQQWTDTLTAKLGAIHHTCSWLSLTSYFVLEGNGS
jgi:hypothetical protein